MRSVATRNTRHWRDVVDFVWSASIILVPQSQLPKLIVPTSVNISFIVQKHCTIRPPSSNSNNSIENVFLWCVDLFCVAQPQFPFAIPSTNPNIAFLVHKH